MEIINQFFYPKLYLKSLKNVKIIHFLNNESSCQINCLVSEANYQQPIHILRLINLLGIICIKIIKYYELSWVFKKLLIV